MNECGKLFDLPYKQCNIDKDRIMYFIPKKDQRLLKASKYFLVIEKGIIFDNGAELINLLKHIDNYSYCILNTPKCYFCGKEFPEVFSLCNHYNDEHEKITEAFTSVVKNDIRFNKYNKPLKEEVPKSMSAIILFFKSNGNAKQLFLEACKRDDDIILDKYTVKNISLISQRNTLKEIKEIAQKCYRFHIKNLIEERDLKSQERTRERCRKIKFNIDAYDQPFNFNFYDPISGMKSQVLSKEEYTPIELDITSIQMETNIKNYLGEDCFIDKDSEAHERAIFMMTWNKLSRQFLSGKKGHITSVGAKLNEMVAIWRDVDFKFKIKRKILLSHLEILRETEMIEANDIFAWMMKFDELCFKEKVDKEKSNGDEETIEENENEKKEDKKENNERLMRI